MSSCSVVAVAVVMSRMRHGLGVGTALHWGRAVATTLLWGALPA
jgi:hypothetical protein